MFDIIVDTLTWTRQGIFTWLTPPTVSKLADPAVPTAVLPNFGDRCLQGVT